MATPLEQPMQAKPVRTFGQQVIAFARRHRLQLGIVGVLAIMWVFFVIAGPILETSMLNDSGLMSTKTGTAPT